MAKAPAALAGLVAVGAETDGSEIGYLTWFAIPDRPVGLNRLRLAWREHGLDERALPPEPRPLFIFKRAMGAQKGKVRGEDGTVTETDVRIVQEDHDLCVYQVSQVQRDLTDMLINYPKAMRVTFDKSKADDPKPFAFEPLDEVPTAEVLPMMDAITQYFDVGGRQIDGPKVRQIVRNFLRDDPDEQRDIPGLRGLNLKGKGGGLYFIEAKHAETLDGLSKAFADLYKDGAGFLYAIPMVDNAYAKELIRQRHIAHSVEEAKDAMNEVNELLKDRTGRGLPQVRSDVVEHHWRKLTQLREREQEYRGILKEEISEIDDQLELLKKQLEKLTP